MRWRHPRLGHADAGRLHPAGRAVLPDARAHRLRHRHRARPGRPVAAGRAAGAGVGQRVRPRPAGRPASPTWSDAGCTGTACPRTRCCSRSTRRCWRARPARAAARWRALADAGRPAQPRRLRHRLLLPGPAQAPAGQRGQDRRRPSIARLLDGPDDEADREVARGSRAGARHPLGGRGGGVAGGGGERCAAMGCDAAQGLPLRAARWTPAAATAWLADHLRPAAARPRRGRRAPAAGDGSRGRPAAARADAAHRGRRLAPGPGRYPVGSGRTGP